MRTEEAFKLLVDRIERLTVERNEARHEQQRQHSELQRFSHSTRRELDAYRVTLTEHRRLLKEARKGKKLPAPPADFLEWEASQRRDEDIPF